jgi:hypothetical protein
VEAGARRFEAHKLGEGAWRIDMCPMAGGALAADEGGVTTVWSRAEELFRCRPGAREEPLGRGAQPASGAGREGVWVAWIRGGRAGELQLLAPGASEPRTIAERASYPAFAASAAGAGPLALLWEERGAEGQRAVRCLVLERP